MENNESRLQFNKINDKCLNRQRITRDEVEFLYNNATNLQLQQLSTIAKGFYHSLDKATYLIMAIVNYTNICVAGCDYCAFYKYPHQKGAYLLSTQAVFAKIDELIKFGGTLVGFNGGFHPDLSIEHYAKLFKDVHARYSDKLDFYELTVAEFVFICKKEKLSYKEGAQILYNSGTRWITGGGAEILDDDFRMRHSPGKFKVDDYFAAQKEILNMGMGSTATMVIGFDETLSERMNHLEKLRTFQDDNKHALPSLLIWNYKPYNTKQGGSEITSNEYFRWLAICRIYLDNFENIRTSVLTKNEQALEGLKYGANDFDIPTEDEVTQKAGATINQDIKAIIQSCIDLGFTPSYRMAYPLPKNSGIKSNSKFEYNLNT